MEAVILQDGCFENSWGCRRDMPAFEIWQDKNIGIALF